MKRILIAVVAAALVVGAVGLTALQPVSAQPGGPPVCLSLPPGEHSFTAPAQDREGEVTFTVTVGEGGVVTGFTEPGGQSIPPAAMLDIFAAADAYPLPDGVSFVECGGDELEGESAQTAAPQICPQPRARQPQYVCDRQWSDIRTRHPRWRPQRGHQHRRARSVLLGRGCDRPAGAIRSGNAGRH